MGTTDTAAPSALEHLQTAFAEYQRLGAFGRDWPAWAALFTDDAEYVEHVIGRFHGVDGILTFILDAMKPVEPMTFSFDWIIFDPPYVAFDIWNIMPNLGDGVNYHFSNLTLLEYAGGGKWKLEEDFYAPRDAGRVVAKWFKAGGTAEMAPDPTITHVSLTAEPSRDDSRGVAEMVAAWRAGTPRYTPDALVWQHGTPQVPAAEAAPFTTPADLVVQDGKRAFLRCGNAGIALTHGGDGTIAFEERASNPTEVQSVRSVTS